ncbi:cyclic nucleotide-binding domain-containing protein [Oscillatoria sp. FACHB-1407]|uniref:sensor histidine kinase n=1 Tax=Oscillatoria sp. FACHB-1407 TaxID=2692847 RepID=UPI0016876378|nr:ATP-binding protein [Oscillatoria sp. FACHB-1407]MBD2463133.1 cyclic nucleotide-binding domain-containing protein [Oscillatoria sp. FACHB-1407]
MGNQLCIDDLLLLEPFQKLPEARLQWVCDRAQKVSLQTGEVLVREGDPHRGLLILVKGQIVITRRSEGAEIPIGRHNAPAFFGEIQVLTDDPAPVTLQALTECYLYEIETEDFRTLLHECREFERMIFRSMERRSRGLESFIRGREKMAALGTLAAGLAHELNNPAAALVRALKEMPTAMLELQRMNLVYGQRQVEPEHTQKWLQIRDAGYEAILNDRTNPVTLSDREESLLEWLEDYGVEKAWKLAEPLAEGDVTPEMLDQLMERWRNDTTELREMGLHWLALSFEVMSMVKHGLRGAERISELVKAMKSYSYLDQGIQQEVDVHQGLEDTLRLFGHKLKQGIQVKRQYDPKVPKVLAFGSELNQVWTNLIDNAIDAMDGKGVLELTTQFKGSSIRVDITDSGSGIPPEIQSRIFEPFFTTKPVGQGSGLGLETIRRIIENRHQGSILFESKPGRTSFMVCLPLNKPVIRSGSEE